jgi:hypothetical protein
MRAQDLKFLQAVSGLVLWCANNVHAEGSESNSTEKKFVVSLQVLLS